MEGLLLGKLGKQRFADPAQPWRLQSSRLVDLALIQHGVAVRQNIAKGHDQIAVWNPIEDLRGRFSALPQRVAGDFQLPLDGGLAVVVCEIRLNVPLAQKARQLPERDQSQLDVDISAALHTGEPGCAR